jgi:hypothetical protein
MANGDLSVWTKVRESTYGVTPINSINWKTLRVKSDSMKGEPETDQSEEITGANVGIADVTLKGINAGGGFECEFSSDSFDDWLEEALGGTWSTGVVQGGTVARSSTYQNYQSDLSGDKYVSYPGGVISSVSLDFQPKEKVKLAANIVCSDAVVAATNLLGTGTLAPADTTPVMRAGSTITGITVDGVAIATLGIRVKSIKLDIKREAEGEAEVNKDGFGQINSKTLIPEITVETYFTNFDMYKKCLAGTAFSFSWAVTDGNDTYTFLMNNCKITSGAPEGAAKGASRMHTWTALGLSDDTYSPLQITKS